MCIAEAVSHCSILARLQVHLNDTICLNITYNPAELSVSLTLTVGKLTIFNKTESAHDPDFCVHVPFLKKLASICVDFSNVTFSNSHFSGCAEAVLEILGIEVEHVDLGCFDIHLLAPSIADPPPLSPAVTASDKGPNIVHYGIEPNHAKRKKLVVK